MIRTALAAVLFVVGAVVAQGSASEPAFACGVVRVPVDVKAEMAAIEKALPKAKLAESELAKVKKLLAAGKSKIARATVDFERELAEAMKLLRLERIFRRQACETMKIPVVTG